MHKFTARNRKTLGHALLCATLGVVTAGALNAQGILTVTPGRGIQTTSGTGTMGYSGNGSAATSATLASPSALAYDASGNLFLADSQNHVIRKVSTDGTITTVAGTGVAGFGGDGALATQAYLDTPTGLAIDANGNIYIADSHNQRIRKVASGIISTVAGTGTAGFSGDGGPATAAQLALPSSVAVDSAGNVYIADTNNQRIRKIIGTTISTVAGSGEELFAGDGGLATAAALDSPTGVTVDANGKIYIADRHNQRVRVVDGVGNISTLAGSGAVTFTGGYSGDGVAASTATLAHPSGVSVDAAGNVFIADTDNQRIRQVGNGTINTVIGTGQQGFAGDGASATAGVLNAPYGITTDPSGNLTVADTLNQRVRASVLPTLTFSSRSVGVPSPPQTVTLSNSGSAPIIVSSMNVSGAFTLATGGSCSGSPILLAASSSCTQNIAFLPTASGATSGSVTFSGTGIVPQSILLSGVAVQAATTTSVTTSATPSLLSQPISFTAVVAAPGSGAATGTVTFYDGGLAFGIQKVVSNSASITTPGLAVGSHSVTAVYSGDANFTGSTSPAVLQVVQDFNFSLVPDPNNPGASTDQTVIPGQTATFKFSVLPSSGAFNFPITFSVAGLPPEASAVFTPSTITLGPTGSTFTMAIKTVPSSTSLLHNIPWKEGNLVAVALLLPFLGAMRRRVGKKPLMLFGLAITSLVSLVTLSGCGTGTGFFGQPQKTYTMTLTATATGPNGATLQHTATVKLTVQ